LPYRLLPVMRADNGPVVVHPDDRKYGQLLVGGQGCGKTSALLRMYLNDIRDPNAAVLLLDPKSSLARRALELTPPDCPKKVWYLDLGRPRFGMSPLRLTGDGSLDDQASAIAGNLASAFEDLFEGQVYQSSKRYLTHAVVGALALAERRGRIALFRDVFALLSPHRDDLRRAAAEACQSPNLVQTLEFFRDALPAEISASPQAIYQRTDAPRNKLEALEAPPSLRRFFNHPTDISMREIVESRDILIIDANMAAVGEDNAVAVLHFVMWMLHAQLQRQVRLPEAERPRVALIADEAYHIASSENIVNQIATHREAGLDVTFGLQYLAQIGAGSERYGEKILKGILNLLQSRYFFRLGDAQDAEESSRIAMAVFQSMIRSDPDSRAQMRVTPESLLNLSNYWAQCTHIAMGSRAASFYAMTDPMPDLDLSRLGPWARFHLDRMASVVGEYPETLEVYDDAPAAPAAVDLSPTDVMAALDGHATASTSTPASEAVEPADTDDAGGADTDGVPTTDGAGSATPAEPAPDDRPEVTAAQDELDPDDEDPDWHILGNVGAELTDDGQPAAAASPEPSSATVLAAPTPAGPEAQLEIQTGRREVQPLIRPKATPPDLERSPVRRLVGATRVAGDQGVLFAEAHNGERNTPPTLLEVAFSDQIVHVGEAEAVDPPEKPPRLFDQDFAVLSLLDRVGLALPGLIHQAVFPKLAPRTFRDRMAKLHRAGLVARHDITLKQKGRGALPSVYSLTRHGLWMGQNRQPSVIPEQRKWRALEQEAGHKLVHDTHTLGWVVALHRLLGAHATDDWCTPRYVTGRFTVPKVGDRRAKPAGIFDIPVGTGIGIYDVPVDEFAEIKPDALCEVKIKSQNLSFDILIELDRKERVSYNVPKFQRYDAFLLGWYQLVRRYRDRHRGRRPVVVFVCPDAHTALAYAKAADEAMTAHLGTLGSDPAEHYFPGREHVFFAVEEDLHHGSPAVLALPPFPPGIRQRVYGSSELRIERVALLPESVLRAGQRQDDD